MIDLPFSAACERNKEPISQVVFPFLKRANSVLEIGTGTAQHAIHFASAQPHISWQTTDQKHYLDGIHAQLEYADISNVLSPVELDVNQNDWGMQGRHFDVIYTANTLHIMSDQDVAAFFNGLAAVSGSETVLIAYGPFKYNGEFTSESNQAFDEDLRSRGEGSCIKDFEEIQSLANQQGFELLKDHSMPANNQCLVWRKLTIN